MARRRRRVRSWHRILGLILALPLLVVSITGVFLNHTVGLRLDEHTVAWPMLMKRYDMGLTGEPISFEVNSQLTVTQWGTECFFNGQSVLTDERSLIGVVVIADQVVLAFESLPLEVYDTSGLLQMQVDDTTYPGPDIIRIGQTSETLVVQSSEGVSYEFTEDLFECSPRDIQGVTWGSASSEPSSELRETMTQAYRGDGLPWSRVLLDLHSGRLFGSVGPWLLDLSVLGLLALVFSGLKLSLRPTRP